MRRYNHSSICTTVLLQVVRHFIAQHSAAVCAYARDSVKRSFDLPPVTDENTRSQCYHAAREAIMEITHRRPGPVQLNIRIVDALQGKFIDEQLPNVRPLQRYMAWMIGVRLNCREKKF